MLRDLGPFSDWVDAARRLQPRPTAPPGEETRGRLRQVLGFTGGAEQPEEVSEGPAWERGGVAGQELAWSVGYGPRTRAVVLRPAGVTGRLPGILALHDHSGFKFLGLEKVADIPGAPDYLRSHRDSYYGGRAYANDLARAGFTVLVHDTFAWGSRRFPLEAMPAPIRRLADAAEPGDGLLPAEVAGYNAAAAAHELMIEKYCALLGTTFAGVVSHEDRVAANYLLSRDDVDPARLGCIGLSGGGNRAALLLATHDQIAAAAIVALMSSYDGLLDHNVAGHTWMLFPHGWARHGDWPDIAASRAPLPLLVQYARGDELFTAEGMAAADERLRSHYAGAGDSDAYIAQWYDGPHRFDVAMQAAAFAWLRDRLAPPVP
ncbi:MAG: hypothetical protein AAGC63_00375 [Propionicimonas sp.]|nr:hypothetical protein [Propionicimonas sp.]